MFRPLSVLVLCLVIPLLSACKASDTSSSDVRPTPNPPVTTPAFACNDGLDNDSDGLVDAADPGCEDALDDDETDPFVTPQCSDGLDNDDDGFSDFPADPGCSSAGDLAESDPLLTRYEMANACWALWSEGAQRYLQADGDNYTATTSARSEAAPFYMKPTALGKYMFYNRDRRVLVAGQASLTQAPSVNATDDAEWTIVGVADLRSYPPTPARDVEPSKEQIAAWRAYDPSPAQTARFVITSATQNRMLEVNSDGALVPVEFSEQTAAHSFGFVSLPADQCSTFPEAESDFTGEPFKGTQPDGTVLGHADVHVHISATEFLGGAHWGHPFHKFGVEQALPNCNEAHGEEGQFDLVGGLFTETPTHATDGWPTFSGWPSRDNLTHEAIYWKWIERAWAGGLRVIVNDLVDNETLCELQRNAVGEPERDCNSMNNAGRQAGTMYAMEDYIDAQYGGPGKGFFQIVHTSEEAREVIEDGKIAVVLGIEISNLFDCKLKYSPLRNKEPFEEVGDNSEPTENTYNCTTEEGKANSILTQMQRVHDWGVRQIISIHEFDNAFGGNGIFDGLILNLGNRENTGGIPSGDIASLLSLFDTSTDREAVEAFLGNVPTTELATGEFWTTYNCPVENEVGANEPADFSGYLWGNSGGSRQFTQKVEVPESDIAIDIELPACVPTGQDFRSGGSTPCYPAGINQCNARWLTQAGLYTYRKMMEMGFLFDWDHMEVGMKTQVLDLAEAQNPPYPFVSTHGTFGGTTNAQATRLLENGGFLYPSNGSSKDFRENMDETFGIYQAAMAMRTGDPLIFGFGYGTDTNGLSLQSKPRDHEGAVPLTYPFQLFSGGAFDTLTGFADVSPVIFKQPTSTDVNGAEVQTWHEDEDGNAHYGMLSDFVQEVVLDGRVDQLKHLYNSAEAYLQTWALTEQSSAAIRGNAANNGQAVDPGGILKRAPVGNMAPGTYQ